ncbi:hypothetical protein ATKI12_5018 [Kitasatospora sp. Ki12]
MAAGVIVAGSLALACVAVLLIPEGVGSPATALVFALTFLASSTGGFALAAGWLRVPA